MMISMLALMASGFLTAQTILVTEPLPDPSTVKTQPVPPRLPTSLSPPTAISLEPPQPGVIEEEDLPPPEQRHYKRRPPTRTGVDTWLGTGSHPSPDPKQIAPAPSPATLNSWLGIVPRTEADKKTPPPNVPAITSSDPVAVTAPPTPASTVTPSVDASTEIRPQAVIPAPPRQVSDNAAPKLIATTSTELGELVSQCKQPGTEDVIKKSFGEDSGMQAIQVSSVTINPAYAKSLVNHVNNLNTMFPCMARMGTNKGDQTFYFEIKDIAGIMLISGEVPPNSSK